MKRVKLLVIETGEHAKPIGDVHAADLILRELPNGKYKVEKSKGHIFQPGDIITKDQADW